MTANAHLRTVSPADLLLKLHHDQTTGVVTVKDERSFLRIYFQGGDVVYADGIDKEAELLSKIEAKRPLDPDQLAELNRIKQNDPLSLGKVLIGQKIISQAAWKKFLHLKVKHILSLAVSMQNPDLGFSAAELRIPSDHFVEDLNTAQLIMDTLRRTRVRKDLWGKQVRFTPCHGAAEAVKWIPLNLSEETVFSLIDGQKNLAEIASATDLDQKGTHRILYLLFSLGLIVPSPPGCRGEADVNYQEIATLYLDLLTILERNFRKESGEEFDNILSMSMDQLSGPSKAFLESLNLDRDSREATVREIIEGISEQSPGTESRLFLQSSFNKLVFLLIMQMKKRLGIGPAEATIGEMTKILKYVEHYRQDTDLMNYVRGNLEDYLRQIKS